MFKKEEKKFIVHPYPGDFTKGSFITYVDAYG
jgi:hypothetical protein